MRSKVTLVITKQYMDYPLSHLDIQMFMDQGRIHMGKQASSLSFATE